MQKEHPKERIMFRGALPKYFRYARENRNKETSAEVLLWSKLKNKQLEGLKFRRQHPLGAYILDFYCHSSQVSIEIDGGYHNLEEQKTYDAERTAFIQESGIRELRFSNEAVMKNIDAVLSMIREACISPCGES